MERKKNKGFTLIEILAVIIIIGIIGVIGIVSVSRYIEDSRKTAFVNVAKNYLDQAKSMKANDELYHDPKNTEAVLIPISEIKIEDDNGKTSYGKIDEDNSYIVIVNEKGKYHYYITLVDETGHAFEMENVNTIDEKKIKVRGKNNTRVQSISSLRNSNVDVEIEIGGITYVVSVKSKADADDEGKINTSTILLDNSVLGEFELDWDYGWTNEDKVITVYTFNEDIEYEYYISTKSQKPLASDSGWQKSNEFVKDLGTYYIFVKSNSNEISDYEEVVIDKIDRVKPSCSLKVNGSPSSYGIYNADYTVLFDTLTDGEASPTTSGVMTRGIVVKGASLDADNEDLDVEVTDVRTTDYLGYVIDKAGNENTCEISVKADGIKPTISYDVAEGLYNTTKNIIITPSDGTGEMDYYDVTVKKDGTVIGTYTGLKSATYTVTLTSDGDYEIVTKAYDTGANLTTKTGKYQIDKTKPTCSLSASGTKSEGEYYGTDVDISFVTTTDPKETGATYTSGVKSYGLNSTTGVKTTKLTTDSEGTTYTGYIVDEAGNQNTCTVTVKRKANFVISYQSNGGTACSNKNVVFNKECGALCSTTRTGYTFVSWNTDSALTNAITSTSIFKNEPKTLYAKWKAIDYTVTFNANGGTTSTTSKTVTYDSTYKTLPSPTRSGYSFNGWYTATSGGTQVTESTTVKITAGQTLYAQWTTCSAGTYSDGSSSTCSTCPSGYTSAAGATAQNKCYISVAAGKYLSTANTTTTTSCAAGTYKAAHTVNYGSTSSCSTCAAGKYSVAGAGSCTTCPSGYTSAAGATAQNKCYISVEAGKYLSTANTTTTVSCAAGTYKAAHTVNYGSTSSCSTCAAGKYSAAGASSCTSCPSGYTSDTGATAKSKCYMNVSGGYYLATANASSASKCAAGTYKASHKVNYGSTSSCSTCSGGTYSAAGASSCTNCPSGQTSNSGASSCYTPAPSCYESKSCGCCGGKNKNNGWCISYCCC